MAPKHNFTVEYKCELLEHLIDNSGTFRDPDLSAFFDYCRTTFDLLKGTTWAGQDLEDKLRAEERIWLNECEGKRGRRRGHEKGSYYDILMSKWKHIWNKLLVKDWQNSVNTGARSWEEVPRSLQKDLKKPTSIIAAPASQDSASAFTSTSTSKSASTLTSKPLRKHEPDSARTHGFAACSEVGLERAVNAAVNRALESNKKQSADAVLAIYEDSKFNAELRQLLVAVLLNTSTPSENERFQVYVQAIKQRLRDAKKAEARLKAVREAEAEEAAVKLEDDPVKAVPHQTATTSHIRSPSSKKSNRDAAISGGRSEDSSHQLASNRPQDSVHTSATGDGAEIGRKTAATEDTLGINSDIPETVKAQLQNDGDAASGATPSHSKSAEGASSKASRRSDESSDSGYETTERRPHRDPLVIQVLGDLQYEPSVQTLLAHDKPLGSDANIRTLRKRRTALEIIKTILIDCPPAKTDLQVFVKRLQEMDAEGRASEVPQKEQKSSDVHQGDGPAKDENGDRDASILRKDDSSEYEDDEDDAGSEQVAKNEEITPRSTRSLRARKAVTDAQSGPRRHNELFCPTASSRKRSRMSEEAGATNADRLGAERVAKRQKVEPDTVKCSDSLNDGNSRDSSPLTELTSEDEPAAKKAVPKATTSQHTSPGKRTIHPLWPVTEDEMIAARHTGALRPSPLHKVVHQSASISPTLPSTNFPNTTPTILKQSAYTLGPSTTASRDAAVARLEAKIDALLQSQSSSAQTPQDSEHAMVSSAESLLKIANSLKEGVLEGQTPDLTRMVARLTRTAAQAVIDAASSAKRAAEAARDISAVLEESASRAELTEAQAEAGAAAPVAKV